jgi:uncharacterized membrane protein YgcG
LKLLTSYYDIGGDMSREARVGVLAYGREATVLLHLNQGTSKIGIDAAIDAILCQGDADQHDLAAAVAKALLEFQLYKRVVNVNTGASLNVAKGIFIYPICPCNECDVTDGICYNNIIDYSQLKTTQVSVITNGPWTGPEDYECLISNSLVTDHESDHLMTNRNFDVNLYAEFALKLARLRCPAEDVVTLPPGPTPRPTPRPTLRPQMPPTQPQVNSLRPTWSNGQMSTAVPTTPDGRYRPHPLHFDSESSNGHMHSSSDQWWDSSSSSSGSGSSSSSSSSSSDHNGLHWSMGSSSSSGSDSSNGRSWHH